jgi:hypothetical protein
MKLRLEIEVSGNFHRLEAISPVENLIPLCLNPTQFHKDCDQVAEMLVAHAIGLHSEPDRLFAKFHPH